MRYLAECVAEVPESLATISRYKAGHGIDMYDRYGAEVNIKTPSANEVIIKRGDEEEYHYVGQNSDFKELNYSQGKYKYTRKDRDDAEPRRGQRDIDEIIKLARPHIVDPPLDDHEFLHINFVNAYAQNNLEKITSVEHRQKLQILNDAVIKQSVNNFARERGKSLS